MQEDFIHFIWQYKLFENRKLQTIKGEEVTIQQVGFANEHAGPDFQHAKIQINGVEWHGHVELHLRASDWMRHKHSTDPAYDNVVLHVVWSADAEIKRKDGTLIPTIELQKRVSENIIFRYNDLLAGKQEIKCSSVFSGVDKLTKTAQIESAAMQRLERKANEVLALLSAKEGDWEQTSYALICQNFGFKVNTASFLRLSELLPLKILLKHKHDLLQTEALLFGIAGFLEGAAADEYMDTLQREYRFLAHKYSLAGRELSRSQWRFLRMRPPNFPTIRIAQLAMLIHERSHFFSFLKDAKDDKTLVDHLMVKPTSYWLEHYDFAKKSARKFGSLGKSSAENVIINTLVPLLVAFGRQADEQQYIDRAILLLEQTKAEANSITDRWKEHGLSAQHAMDSQGMIEQFNMFCKLKKCLSCKIGISIIK